MMNISPMVNSVKCTFFACFVHLFLHVLRGCSTADGGANIGLQPIKRDKKLYLGSVVSL